MIEQERAAQSTAGADANVVQMDALVHGDVQGVNFRFHTRQQAVRLGISGYVENRSDGTVHVLAHGERSALLVLLAWLQRGPSAAEVSGVDVQWGTPAVRYASFVVRH